MERTLFLFHSENWVDGVFLIILNWTSSLLHFQPQVAKTFSFASQSIKVTHSTNKICILYLQLSSSSSPIFQPSDIIRDVRRQLSIQESWKTRDKHAVCGLLTRKQLKIRFLGGYEKTMGLKPYIQKLQMPSTGTTILWLYDVFL